MHNIVLRPQTIASGVRPKQVSPDVLPAQEDLLFLTLLTSFHWIELWNYCISYYSPIW